MDRLDLQAILSELLAENEDISGFNFSAGNLIRAELFGELSTPPMLEDLGALESEDTELIANLLLENRPELKKELIESGSCDFSFEVSDANRFRVNIFRQSGQMSVVLRRLSNDIKSLDDLQSPKIFRKISQENYGLIVVAGATNQGKSTTIAAILNEININNSNHIVTLEDPIEFVHRPKKSVINQREKGSDFVNYSEGLRSALRQSPHVIVVGEVRDPDEMEVVLSAAETGHLVITTIHASSVRGTIQRMTGMFSGNRELEIRNRLATSLKWIVGQRLIPREGGGLTAIHEIIGNNFRVQEAIKKGESQGRTYENIIEKNSHDGWQTFDDACIQSYKQKLISADTAVKNANVPGNVQRDINHLQNSVSGYFSAPSGLRLADAE